MSPHEQWYAAQERYSVRYIERMNRWIIHDTAIGCQWAARLATKQDAVMYLYNERTRYLAAEIA